MRSVMPSLAVSNSVLNVKYLFISIFHVALSFDRDTVRSSSHCDKINTLRAIVLAYLLPEMPQISRIFAIHDIPAVPWGKKKRPPFDANIIFAYSEIIITKAFTSNFYKPQSRCDLTSNLRLLQITM